MCGLWTSVNQSIVTRQSALPLSLVKLPWIMSSAIPLCPTDNELAHGGKIDIKQKGEIVLKLSLSVAIWFYLQKSISSSLSTACVISAAVVHWVTKSSRSLRRAFSLESNENEVFLQWREKKGHAQVCIYVHACDYRLAIHTYENNCKADAIDMYSWKSPCAWRLISNWKWVIAYCVNVHRYTHVANGC